MKKVVLIMLVVWISLIGRATASDKYLAVETVKDWDEKTVQMVAQKFVESRLININHNSFQFDYWQTAEDLILVFVKYEVINGKKIESRKSEIVFQKFTLDKEKTLRVVLFGEQGQFLEISENYNYSYDQVYPLYKGWDKY